MKIFYTFLITFSLLIGLFLSTAFINRENDVSEKHVEVVLRDIGHQLLLQAQDSTSRILPIHKIADNIYQISFQNKIKFIPDSLIEIVHKKLERYQLPQDYIVNVKDCGKKETIFAYEISANTGDLLPCRGRETVTGCYLIEIEFIPDNPSNKPLMLLYLIPFCCAGLYLKAKPLNKKSTEKTFNKNIIRLGNFIFFAEKNILEFQNKIIPLSEKETKLLKIFTAHINQMIGREILMKEIWENEGTIVISRNVDVLVSKLRKKLSDDHAIKIVNVHGRGYKLIIEKA